MSNYAYFYTQRPMKFGDFDKRAARVSSGSVGVYSWTYLYLWRANLT